MDDVYWKIIFDSNGKLTAACMQDFDERDYEGKIAIDKRFASENEAEFVVLALNAITDPINMLRAVKLLEGE